MNEKLQAMQKQYSKLVKDAKALLDQHTDEDGQMPTEYAEKADSFLGKSDELLVSIQRMQRAEEAAQMADEGQGTKAAHHGWRPAAPEEGLHQADQKAWNEIELKGGRTIRYHVPEVVRTKGYPDAFEAYVRKGKAGMGPQDLKTIQLGDDSAGGFLAPEEYNVNLIKKLMTMATIRQLARVAQTSRDMAKWPRINYTTDDKYTSGVRMSWVGETPASATVHRVTDPVFGIITVPVYTAMASMPITNDSLEDSAFDVFGLSAELMAEAFALGENDAFINGNGIARPMGILTQVDDSDNKGPRSVDSGTDNAVTMDGLIDTEAALPPQYEANARWVMNKATKAAIHKIEDSDGAKVWPVVAQDGNLGATPMNLLGYPVIRDQFVPDITTDGYPVIFGDLTGYLVLDRVGLSLQRLTERYAEENVTVLLARRRLGGQVVAPWQMKVLKAASS